MMPPPDGRQVQPANAQQHPHPGSYDDTRKKKRNRFIGWGLRLVGTILIIFGIPAIAGVSAYLATFPGETYFIIFSKYSLVAVAAMFACAAVVAVGRMTDLNGRRTLAPFRSCSLGKSGEFVLFLRSFDVDRENDSTSSTGNVGTFLVKSGRTREEEIVAAVGGIGRMEAFGNPRYLHPLAGSHRHFRPDGNWLNEIIGYIGRARLVLIEVGPTIVRDKQYEIDRVIRATALWEEIVEAVWLPKDEFAGPQSNSWPEFWPCLRPGLRPPEKLVFLIPSYEMYREFLCMCSGIFPKPLPDCPPDEANAKEIPFKAAIYFDPDFTPHLVRFGMSRSYRWWPEWTESSFVYQLKPVYERLGASWPGISLKLPYFLALTKGNLFRPIAVVTLSLAATFIGFQAPAYPHDFLGRLLPHSPTTRSAPPAATPPSGALSCPMPDLYPVRRQMPVAPEFVVELFPLGVKKPSNKRVFFHDHETRPGAPLPSGLAERA
jgi:hypothetical protein